MSSTMGCRILAKLGRSRLSDLSPRIIIVKRFSGTAQSVESATGVAPAPQPGKIQAALLKEFSSPLVIENLESPRRTQETEVGIEVDWKLILQELNIIYQLMSCI